MITNKESINYHPMTSKYIIKLSKHPKELCPLILTLNLLKDNSKELIQPPTCPGFSDSTS